MALPDNPYGHYLEGHYSLEGRQISDKERERIAWKNLFEIHALKAEEMGIAPMTYYPTKKISLNDRPYRIIVVPSQRDTRGHVELMTLLMLDDKMTPVGHTSCSAQWFNKKATIKEDRWFTRPPKIETSDLPELISHVAGMIEQEGEYENKSPLHPL